jgi:hypothetical protein
MFLKEKGVSCSVSQETSALQIGTHTLFFGSIYDFF